MTNIYVSFASYHVQAAAQLIQMPPIYEVWDRQVAGIIIPGLAESRTIHVLSLSVELATSASIGEGRPNSGKGWGLTPGN